MFGARPSALPAFERNPGVLLEPRFAFAAECPPNDACESGNEDPVIDCQFHLSRHYRIGLQRAATSVCSPPRPASAPPTEREQARVGSTRQHLSHAEPARA